MSADAAIHVAENVFWAFGMVCVVVTVGGWLWNRRPWQRRQSFADYYADILAKAGSKVEAQHLAELEAEVQAQGCDIWRPDPQRVREAAPRG